MTDAYVTEHVAWPLIAIGIFLLLGYAAHVFGSRAHVPRVTLLLLVGVALSPNALGVIPEGVAEWFPLVSEVALSMVGFMLGERFLARRFREIGKLVITVSVAETLCAAFAVLLGLLVIGVPIEMALILAGIAPASAPAATVDVIREVRARGPLSDCVLSVVAIDDVYGILLFSLLFAISQAIPVDSFSWQLLVQASWEIVGAIGLGALIGIPMAWVSGHARPGELTLIETLGFVLLCGGLAIFLEVSYLMASIALGAVVANRAKHHERPFHAIEGISQPFLVVFFLLAGFEFDASQFTSFGLAGVTYVAARSFGLIGGGYIGARIAGAPPTVQKYIGWCLLPQAGVALGLGLLAAQRFPQHGAAILSLIVGTTFLFEILGPVATRVCLRLAGEIRAASDAE